MKCIVMFCLSFGSKARQRAVTAVAVCAEGSRPGNQVVLQVRHANPEDPRPPDAARCSFVPLSGLRC